MRFASTPLLFALALPLSAEEPVAAPVDSAALARASAAEEKLAVALWRSLASRSQAANLVCSPWGVMRVLALSGSGARGETLAEHTRALGLDPSDEAAQRALAGLERLLGTPGERSVGRSAKASEGDLVRSAGGLWVQKGEPLLPAFTDPLARVWGLAPEPLDFRDDPGGAAGKINGWVKEQTAGKIPELVSPDDLSRAAVVLGHAVYLDAGWLCPFEKALTSERPFKRLDGSEVQVPLMRMHDVTLMTSAGEGWIAAELPYQAQRLSFLLIVPDAGRFAEVEAGLERVLREAVEKLPRWPKPVIVALPRFQIDSALDLLPALSDLGIRSATVSGEADFSGIDGKRELFVELFRQRAFIEVDEVGTRAGAATLESMTRSSPAEVIADRPFLFAVRDRDAGTVLFLGKVTDPTGKGAGGFALPGLFEHPGPVAPWVAAGAGILVGVLLGLRRRRQGSGEAGEAPSGTTSASASPTTPNAA